MKKCIRIMVTVLVITLFASCTKGPASSSSATSASSDIITAKTFDGPLVFHDQLIYGNGNENGFYQILVRMDGNSNLSYIDYQSKTNTILCNKPGCGHDVDTCPAWSDVYYNSPYLLAWKDKLIIVSPGNPYYYDEKGDKALSKIEIANTDGSDRKILYTFDNSAFQIGDTLATDNRYLYMMVCEVDLSQTLVYRGLRYTIYALDLTTGECSRLADFPDIKYMFLVGVAAEELIVKIIITEPGTEYTREEHENQTHELYGVRADGNTHFIKSWKQDELRDIFFNNMIYFVSGTSILEMDPQSGDEKTFLENFEFSADHIFGTFNDDAGFMINGFKPTESGEDIIQTRCLISTTPPSVTWLTLIDHPKGSPVIIFGASSSHFLVVTEQTNVAENGIRVLTKLALILKTDFYVNNPNYVMIENAF